MDFLRSLKIDVQFIACVFLIAAIVLLIGVAPSLSQQQNRQCDPAYPSVCIPSPPPDLDCGDIEYRRFEVLQPDPHRFDGDKDGIGCERG